MIEFKVAVNTALKDSKVKSKVSSEFISNVFESLEVF